jgi:putative DNA primase/helicase
MVEFSSEAILLRRKACAAQGYHPVPLDRDGNPVGAAWRAEALEDPPRATVTPVDPKAPHTGLLLGAEGDGEALIALVLGVDETLGPAVVEALAERIGRTPLWCWRSGEVSGKVEGLPKPIQKNLALLYRSRRSAMWDWAEIRSAGAFPIDGEGDEWPKQRPEEVAFAALPTLDDNEVWIEALADALGNRPDLFDDVEIEEAPLADEPPPSPRREPRAQPLGPPPDQPEPPPAEPPDGPPPEIIIYAGERHRACDEGLKALYRLGAKFYNRSAELVRIASAPAKDSAGRPMTVPVIQAVPLAALGRALGQAANWYRLVPKPKRGRYRVDPPAPVVEMIASMSDEWHFPPLVGILKAPSMRPDCSIITEPGYDRVSGVYADFRGLKMPHIPARPTRRQAETAMAVVLRALDNFPFVEERDRAAAVSAMITVCVRGALPVAPALAISSPAPGSGKSFLSDCISAIATGERAAVIAVASKEEETEKRLVGAALAGNQQIVLDNVRRLLEGDFLCQVTERPLMQLRPLSTSDLRLVKNIFTLIANGNNIVVAADLTRRFVRISIDPNCERPELRQFDSNPFEMILAHRGEFIAACLTIPRYYTEAGRPNLRPRVGSYSDWSDLVRSSICHLGLPDPLQTQTALIANDPVAGSLRAVFAAWSGLKTLGLSDPRGHRVRDLMEDAQHDEELLHALLEVAEGQGGNSGKLDHSRLSRWLAHNENRIAGGFKLIVDRSDPSRPRWRLEPVLLTE